MNRIILIGNGFDLAHDLKTEYKHFIGKFWEDFSGKICNKETNGKYFWLQEYKDEPLVEFQFNSNLNMNFDKDSYCSTPSLNGLKDMIKQCKAVIEKHYSQDAGMRLHFKSKFFEAINDKLDEQKWVDIEEEYFRLVKDIYRRQSELGLTDNLKKELKKLNDDLCIVRDRLTDYLTNEKITDDILNDEIKQIILQPFNPRDISNGGQEYFSNFIKQRFEEGNNPEQTIPYYWEARMQSREYYNYGHGGYGGDRDIVVYITDTVGNNEEEHEKWIRSDSRRSAVPKFFLMPDDIFFLNFNYTSTANLYTKKISSRLKINHIHGELDENAKNPIIFGYGDEMDELYKKIADCNENEYLQNIKSIRYLKTDKYRQLLTFINSAPYQIYIMGHSCGNSDRTLLNTLFEHKHCVSIKPFYYKQEDYIGIVQNISRNFKDATLMRDRVVNETYCVPLPQNTQIA